MAHNIVIFLSWLFDHDLVLMLFSFLLSILAAAPMELGLPRWSLPLVILAISVIVLGGMIGAVNIAIIKNNDVITHLSLWMLICILSIAYGIYMGHRYPKKRKNKYLL